MRFGSIFRFPLSLRMVEEMLAARGICMSYETVRQWAIKFGETFSDQIRRRAPARGDKWHLDEVAISIAGEPYWVWRAVDQNGFVLDVLVQRRRDCRAAQRRYQPKPNRPALACRVNLTVPLALASAPSTTLSVDPTHRPRPPLDRTHALRRRNREARPDR